MMRPLLNEFLEKGYSPRELFGQAVHDLLDWELTTVLGWQQLPVPVSGKEYTKPKKKIKQGK
jgi:hypothetical protein